MQIILKNRISYWDNLKGLMIILVVLGHILALVQTNSYVADRIYTYIYMFHMPVFVFISGFFGKSTHARSWKSLGKFIFLYLIFNSFVGFFYGFDSLLIPKYSYWYLLALVVWRFLTPYLVAYKNILFLLLIFALFAGFFPSIDNTLALSRIIGFFPFYVAGYLLTSEKSKAFTEESHFKHIIYGIFTLVSAAILAFGCESVFHYDTNFLRMGAYTNISIGAIARIGLYIIAFISIFSLRCLTPVGAIPLLTTFGKNSLWIFLFHRPFVLMLQPLFNNLSSTATVTMSLLFTLGYCLIFGNSLVANLMDKFTSDGLDLFTPNKKSKFSMAQIVTLCVCLGFLFMIFRNSYSGFTLSKIKTYLFNERPKLSFGPHTSKAISQEEQEKLDKAFRLTFAGDLILLEDQVKRGYNGSGYDFTDVFEYAKPYIESADFAIGVFEGPMAGEAAGFSTSNFADGKELLLNFPDEFAVAVKNAGFDLVTTANNHLLEKGIDGALRTLDVLDNVGIAHTGSYRNAKEKEKNHIKLVQYAGIKMAILSYTYGSNYVDTERLLEEDINYITSIIPDTKSAMFERIKKQVVQDFEKAKALNPDLIIVLPHIGTQFSNKPDETQKIWFEIFKENGADIILGDHTHVVEPIILEKRNAKTVLTVYSPGNFANIFREYQGDTSVLVDVYIDRNTKEIIGASIVPLYTHARAEGNYRALPIFEMLYNNSLREQLSTDDLKFAKNSHDIITDVLFGHIGDISAITKRYYINNEGFVRVKQRGLKLTEEMRQSSFLKILNKVRTVCFIGDSITEGSKNEGYPWYEPIEPFLSAQQIFNYSAGGATVSDVLNQADEIPTAQAYVIAIGTNDIRYRNPSKCAMMPQDFVKEIDILKQKLLEKSPQAIFVFIAPWYSTDGDPFSPLKFQEKNFLMEKYSMALEQYCKNNGILYINPNNYIRRVLQRYPQENYLLDHIHPNAAAGIIMYSQAVLLSSLEKRDTAVS